MYKNVHKGITSSFSEFQTSKKGAVCIVSGGLDSVCTAAYLAHDKGYDLFMLSYLYGQRAEREIQQAKYFATILGAKEHQIIDITFMKELYGRTNALTFDKYRLPDHFDYSLVVPIRNAVFITIATSWAMSIGAKLVALGAHADDFRYPDCRAEFISSIMDTLNLAEADGINSGVRQKVTIWTPSSEGIGKGALLQMGYRILGDKIFETWSCYTDGKGVNSQDSIHCGRCESCINRKVAISKAGIRDKTTYAKDI
jgi:7-cyano-7-deazaguanine synthase